VKAGETAHLTAHGITLEGAGIGSLEGREVDCHGLFPSEVGQVRIEAVAKHNPRAHARLVSLEVAHPGRREAPCPQHVARGGRCTGCAIMELDETAQRTVKLAMLRERVGLPVSAVEPAPLPFGYRWSSKRVVYGRAGDVRLGSYMRGTHQPADMNGCLVDHPRLVEAFDDVAAHACELGIEPYDERNGAGDLRHVWAKTNGERVLVTLIVTSDTGRAARELPAALKAAGVLVSVHAASDNRMRGSDAQLVRGVAELTTTLLGQSVEVGAFGFLQPNPRVAEACYGALTQRDEPGRLALDLYAGAGVTTRALRTHFREVTACESHPESARALGIAPESVEAFLRHWLANSPVRVPELVIANPPRKGLGPEVCASLIALGAGELRIMSCGPEGLARDLTALGAGGYTLVALRAFDTLPQTPHIELVASLQRQPR
jgi:23S rRNA (uracil1939-C5)-methyltransferase